MFFKKKKNKEIDLDLKRNAKKLDKLFTGVIIGGAIGSVVGATLSDKEKRETLKEKGKEFIEHQKENIKEHIEESKNNEKSFIGKIVRKFKK